MSSTGRDAFDKTVQVTNIWLDEISNRTGPDRQFAWKVLSTVLCKLGDRLQPDLAAKVGAQIPVLVRGAHHGHHEPSKQHAATDEDFVNEVADGLSDARLFDLKDVIAAVLAILDWHAPAGQLEKVRQALPKDVRCPWRSGALAAA